MSLIIEQAIDSLILAERAYSKGDLSLAHTYILKAELEVEVARGSLWRRITIAKEGAA